MSPPESEFIFRPSTVPVSPALIIEPRDAADKVDAIEQADPIENAETAEPTDPIDNTEPIEPTDKNDPRLPTHNTESSDQSDHFEFLPMPTM